MPPTLCGVALALFGILPTSARAASLTADDAVRSALSRHPDVVASDARVRAADLQHQSVGLFLENPEISGGIAAVGGLIQGTLNQPLSVSGEGWHARRAAAAGVDHAEADARRTALRVAAEARATYAWVVTTRERWSLADEAMQQATRLREAAVARQGVGEGSPLDVRLARLAEAEATHAAIQARRDHARARSVLALYVPGAPTVDLVDEPSDVVPEATGGTVRSDLTAALARVRQADAAVARERAASIPRIGVGLFAQRDALHGDPGDVGPQLTLALPLWNRNQDGRGEALAEAASARADLESRRSLVSVEQALLPEVSAYADAALGRLGDFAGDARGALAAIEVAWTTGEIDVSDAVLLRREVLDGWAAALDARQATVEARLDLLLANEDPALIPAPDEEAP